MDIERILADLKQERERIDQAIKALGGLASKPKAATQRGRSPKAKQTMKVGTKSRTMSSAARKRVSEMMKLRWAARKRGDDEWGGPLIKKSFKVYRAH